jgi:hypothetical protein
MSNRRTATIPFVCATVNTAATLAMAFWLRGGLEVSGGPAERGGYIVAHLVEWRTGWALWAAAALSLVVFFGWWGARLRSHEWAVTALVVAIMGLGFDWAAEAVYIGWFPDRMLTLGRAATWLTGAAGNGLYTAAGIMLTLKSPMIGGVLRSWTWTIWLLGLGLVVATVAANPMAMAILTAALMTLFCPWVAVVGWKLR